MKTIEPNKPVREAALIIGRFAGAVCGFAILCWFFCDTLVVSVPNVADIPLDEALKKFGEEGKSLETIPSELDKNLLKNGKPPNVLIHKPPIWKTIRGAVITLELEELRETVPNVVGMHEFEAKILLEGKGFKVVTGKNWCPAEPEGTVTSQQPEPDVKWPPEEAITISVSAGTDLFSVPRVIGKSVKEAKEILEGAGFIARDVEAKPADDKRAPPGTVFDQTPTPKDRAYRGCEVALKVAPKEIRDEGREVGGEEKGQPVEPTPKEKLVRVPSVLGKEEGNAEKTLEEAGFKVNVGKIISDRVIRGKVIDQTPSGLAKRGTTVTIKVSSGPPPPTLAFTFCRKCGRSIPTSAEICPRCGRPPR